MKIKEYRNLGIGQQVLKEIKNIAKDMNRDVELDVYGDNPAIYLYERLGFKEHYKNMILKIDKE